MYIVEDMKTKKNIDIYGLLLKVIASLKTPNIRKYIHSEALKSIDNMYDEVGDYVGIYFIDAEDVLTGNPSVIFYPKKETANKIVVKLQDSNINYVSKLLYNLFVLIKSDVIFLTNGDTLLLKEYKKIFNIK